MGYTWTTALCRMDSDGDGVSNGRELGDPNCTVRGTAWQERHSSGMPEGLGWCVLRVLVAWKPWQRVCQNRSWQQSCEGWERHMSQNCAHDRWIAVDS